MQDAIACDHSLEVFWVGRVVNERLVRNIRHSSLSLMKDDFRSAGVPLTRSGTSMNIKMGLALAEHGHFQANAAGPNDSTHAPTPLEFVATLRNRATGWRQSLRGPGRFPVTREAAASMDPLPKKRRGPIRRNRVFFDGQVNHSHDGLAIHSQTDHHGELRSAGDELEVPSMGSMIQTRDLFSRSGSSTSSSLRIPSSGNRR